MISYTQSDMASLDCGQENILRASITWSADALPSRGKDSQHSAGDKLSELLTVHHYSHILEKAAHDLESLRCGYPSLLQGETV